MLNIYTRYKAKVKKKEKKLSSKQILRTDRRNASSQAAEVVVEQNNLQPRTERVGKTAKEAVQIKKKRKEK